MSSTTSQCNNKASSKKQVTSLLTNWRGRSDLETLLQRTPADGLVAGLGDVNGDAVGKEAA